MHHDVGLWSASGRRHSGDQTNCTIWPGRCRGFLVPCGQPGMTGHTISSVTASTTPSTAHQRRGMSKAASSASSGRHRPAPASVRPSSLPGRLLGLEPPDDAGEVDTTQLRIACHSVLDEEGVLHRASRGDGVGLHADEDPLAVGR